VSKRNDALSTSSDGRQGKTIIKSGEGLMRRRIIELEEK
jgi:hypothetical protein